MLVLTRKPQEVIHIGADVTITIVRVSKNSVRIGIDAPRDLPIARGELTTNDTNDTCDVREKPRFEPRGTNRLLPAESILARVKSLTIVQSPDEPARPGRGLTPRTELAQLFARRKPKGP